MGLDKIIDHVLVPKHEIVPQDKVAELLVKFGPKAANLPQILRDDPAVEEIGAKRGDIVKITRDSHTAGKSVYFRVVV
ncbi:MAG: DNA-directed RNA polymerase subunit H [Candidatus Diapherotrites archaeon CG11_big_fil_rev_8_21_14_0_20_37_9]|nr:MAG: DNA-directed RNA polymerase subunit H [Candidatus Diapherotrites archaeon CG11_big_fil_rev_8_21_14_0_20_37_9]